MLYHFSTSKDHYRGGKGERERAREMYSMGKKNNSKTIELIENAVTTTKNLYVWEVCLGNTTLLMLIIICSFGFCDLVVCCFSFIFLAVPFFILVVGFFIFLFSIANYYASNANIQFNNVARFCLHRTLIEPKKRRKYI